MYLNLFCNNIKKCKPRKMEKFILLLFFHFLKQKYFIVIICNYINIILLYLFFSAVIFINYYCHDVVSSFYMHISSFSTVPFLFSPITYLSFTLVSILHFNASIIDFNFTFLSLFSLDFYHINSVSSLFIVEYKIHTNPLFSSFVS